MMNLKKFIGLNLLIGGLSFSSFAQNTTINASTFGVLGDVNEPLLKLAIEKITGTSKGIPAAKGKTFEFFKDDKSIRGFSNDMYLETIPEGLLKSL